MTESEFLHHESCSCGSSDGTAVYSDGHKYCFVCGKYTHGDGQEDPGHEGSAPLLSGWERNDQHQHMALPTRNIHLATCEFYDYTVGKFNGQNAQFAKYYTANGELAGVHVRSRKNGAKNFSWVLANGIKVHDLMPFGWQRWQHRAGKKIVVTEGEIDCLSVSQVQENKWPVVSIPTGAGPQVKKYMAHHRDWFARFEEVVLMFDNDEVGRESAKAAAEVLGPRAKIASLPRKDPNEMLVHGEVKELYSAIWQAQRYMPAEIVTLDKLRESVLAGPEVGISFPWTCMNEWTYGIRLGELHTFGAGTGVGKTEFFTEIALHLVKKHDKAVAMFMLEQEPRETATRLAGKLAKKRFHIPPTEGSPEWSIDELRDSIDNLISTKKIFLYDSFGMNDWEILRERIRYLRHSENVRFFFLDHLTALADWQEDPRAATSLIMSEMGGLVKELGITLFLISHLNTPEGRPHEEGGRVTVRNFRNSRAIGFWSVFMWGLERNQQHDDPEQRNITTLRCLKDRYTGNGTGKTATFGYNRDTGELVEMEHQQGTYGGPVFTDTTTLGDDDLL